MKNLTFDLTERVKQIIEYYGLNPYSMSVKISVSEGTIRKFLAGQIGMKVETLTKILTIFDEISSDWLILGKGEMLRQNVPIPTEKYTCDEQHVPQNANQGTFPADNAMCEKIIADLRSELAAAYRTIGQLEYRLQQEGEKTNSTSEKTGMAITLA